ncbi:MAG: phosphatidate cytidylyltransferase [Gammaproteobacteria bacterium]|nr:phosphatidate cytidylyltransferase [Gammaproteobacteria bacterium]MCW5583208.1 phosphatidate cytidylyltransferase [Gammaproteobacteria bacterium]
MLKQRIMTAFILIPIVLVVLFYLPPAVFRILTAAIALGGAWEWTGLMEIQLTSKRSLYVVLVALLFGVAIFIPINLAVFIFVLAWWLFASALIFYYPQSGGWWSKSVAWRGVMGMFVLLPCWVAINYIRDQDDGLYALLFLFVLIWGADSVAYFIGKKWGRNKLVPFVSPGKSKQGLYGAIIFSILITVLTLSIFHTSFVVWPWAILLSVVTVIFSVIGDLFESMMKRQAGLKDSGSLLPGHGGLLDRIDSLTAAAPIFVLGSMLLGMYFD